MNTNQIPTTAQMKAALASIQPAKAVRQTGSGVSLATDAFGRLHSRVDSFDATGRPPGEQQEALPVGAVPTLYPTVGTAVGLVTGAGVLVVLGWLLIVRRRTPGSSSEAEVAERGIPDQVRDDGATVPGMTGPGFPG